MRTQQRFANTDEPGADLVIQHNNSEYDAEGRKVGLYVHGGSEFATYSVDDIPEMIEVLQDIYDDFEANKPEPEKPTLVADILDPLPDGSIVRFTGEQATWVKIQGEWFNTVRTYLQLASSIPRDQDAFWNTVVVYNPEEAN